MNSMPSVPLNMQLYAQVLHEIRELKSPYWFNNEQVARIQELNLICDVKFMPQR